MRWFTILAATVAAPLLAAPLAAQRIAPSIQVTPYAGYMRLGSLVSGPLGTSFGAAGAPVYGGQLSVGLTPNIALVGNLAHTAPGLRASAPLLGGVSLGSRSVWLYDAGIRLHAPVGGGVDPFVEGGAGGMRQTIASGPASLTRTGLAWHLGAGAVVPLGSRLGLQVMATDYISRVSSGQVLGIDLGSGTTHNVAISAGLRLGL